MSNANTVRYEVLRTEYAFSGAISEDAREALVGGKRAKARALECAYLAFVSIGVGLISVKVVQRGGAADGAVIFEKKNPDAHMPAGEPYCAGIYVEKDGRIMAIHAVSRDSRETHTTPQRHTVTEMKLETGAAL